MQASNSYYHLFPQGFTRQCSQHPPKVFVCLFSEEEFNEDGPSDVSEEHGTQQPFSQTVQDSHQPLKAG